jgi:hypothetical protein
MAKAPAAKPKPKAAAKSKSSFDFMGLLVQHGERVGLIAAGGICVLLVLTSLFWPGAGFFAESPDGKASELEQAATRLRSQLASAQPNETHLPPTDSKTKRLTLDSSEVKSEKYMLASLIPDVSGAAGSGRRVPSVFPIDEAVADVGRVQIKSYILSRDLSTITCLEVDNTGGAAGGQSLNLKGLRGRLRGGMGGPGMGGPGGPGMPGPGGPGMPGMGGPGMPGGYGNYFGAPDQSQLGGNRQPKKAVQVKVDELEKKQNIVPAIQIRPERVVVIAASFPYKKQIEEFQSKLNLRSPAEVLMEGSAEQTASVLNSFRFLRVDVERRELDLDGKPVGDWALQDLKSANAPYRQLYAASGKETEQETGDYARLMFGGMAMPKLKQFRPGDFFASAGAAGPGMPGGSMPGPGDDERGPRGPGFPGDGGFGGAAQADSVKTQYPEVELKLKNIVATLDKLKEKPDNLARPSRFDSGDNFDPFNPAPPVGAGGNDPFNPGMPMPGAGPGGSRPGLPMPGGPGAGGPGSGGGYGYEGGFNPNQELTLPDHSLIRIIDVNVAPGKAYEYRMRVVMANPNKGRKDVASPRYADIPELASEWSTIPIKVRLEPELYFYAVDQKAAESADNPRARYEGPYARAEIKPGMLMMQAHTWLRNTKLKNGAELIVGEWTVAERFPVFRGEYVGRTERVKVPVWSYTRESFTFPKDHNKLEGVEVPFGYQAGINQPEPILVDFIKGRTTYDQVIRRDEDDNAETVKVTDDSGVNALILNPDGRLVLLEGALDLEDKVRIERLKATRERIKEVEKQSKPVNPGGVGPGGPFGEP